MCVNKMDIKSLYIIGMRHAIPIVLGYIPVAIAYAILAMQNGFSEFETILLSLTMYSGSSQVLFLGMVTQGATLAALLIGIFLINFRYFIMSTCVNSRILDSTTITSRVLLSFFITDESFAIFTTAPSKRAKLAYLLGLFTVSYIAWFSGTVIGVVANSILPTFIIHGLGIALYALFIALIMPGVKRSQKILFLVIATALFNTLLTRFLDFSWSIVISTLVMSTLGALLIKDENEGKPKDEENNCIDEDNTLDKEEENKGA